MTLPLLPADIELNTVYTARAETFLTTRPLNQFYPATPTMSALRAHKKEEDGGDFLVCPVQVGLEPVGIWYRKAQQFGLHAKDPITQARYEWSFLEEPIVIYHQDERKANGTAKKLSLVDAMTQSAMDRIKRKLATAIYATSPEAHELQGLRVACSTSTGTTYGGISATTYTWWDNYRHTSGTVFASQGPTRMAAAFDELARLPGMAPTEIFTTASIYESYEALAVGATQMTRPTTQGAGEQGADLGYPHLWYRGVPVYIDHYCPSGTMWFLNHDAIQLVEMAGGAFTLNPGGFQYTVVNGLMARVAVLRWEGQLGTYCRKGVGVISAIT